MFDDLLKAPKNVNKAVNKAGNTLDKKVGKALVAGHNDPFGSFLGVMGAPQRALQSGELGQWDKVGHNFMTPSTEKNLAKGVKDKIGLSGLESGALAGNDLGHKFARGALDFGLDAVNDPVSWIPLGKIAKIAGTVGKGAEDLNALGRAASGIADKVKDSKVGALLNNEHDIRGLTNHGRATLEAVQNNAKEAATKRLQAGQAVIARHADELRNGKMPDEVRSLFKGDVPEVKKGMRVQDITDALRKDGSTQTSAEIRRGLKDSGITGSPEYIRGMGKQGPGAFFKDSEKISEAQAAIEKRVAPTPEKQGPISQLTQGLTRAGNKAFLTLPFAHGGNLANLAYNRYGVGTTLKGIGNAARVATGNVGKGRLAQNIEELGKTGAHSQYGNIYDELGISRIAGLPGTEGTASALNKGVILPFERGANYLQNKFLNPLETGLRSASLDTERRLGNTGVDAARNIHRAYGSDSANLLSQAASSAGTSFGKFHAQTAVGSGLRTLATNPGRAVNPVKADRDFNNQINPGSSPKFHLAIPGMDTARAVTDPLHYFATLLGPTGQLGDAYSSLSQAQKGKVSAAIAQVAGRYIPSEALLDIAKNIATKQKGQAGEAATSDVPSLFTGGYYQKPK